MGLSLRVLVVYKRRGKEEWQVWLLKRFPSVEMRVCSKPALTLDDDLLAKELLPLQEPACEFAMRALTMEDDPLAVLDELLQALIRLVVHTAGSHSDLDHKILFVKELNRVLPFALGNKSAIVVNFPSTWGKPFPSSDLVQRIDNQSVTFYPTTAATVGEVCLVQWQTDLPWRGDFPLTIAYRLRAAPPGGYQIVLKVTNNATPTAIPIQIKLHLPVTVSRNASKLKLNNNLLSPQMEENCITLELPTSTPILLLQGFVECAPPSTVEGETSCAEVHFEFPQPECELTCSTVAIRPRVIKSGKFFVWNPFGDLPKGHLSVTKV
ncbi:hypothetical protein BASA81_006676 [Batrachochytrium salamandrivorans]|nr:hypothetical protein BASA81_006676 [Batrachochytrium salamandrivorans]